MHRKHTHLGELLTTKLREKALFRSGLFVYGHPVGPLKMNFAQDIPNNHVTAR